MVVFDDRWGALLWRQCARRRRLFALVVQRRQPYFPVLPASATTWDPPSKR